MGYLDDIVDNYLIELEKRELREVYRREPARWAKDKLGFDLWYKQEEAAISITKNANTAVKAGHGVGKSFLAALLACWWIDTHPVGTAFVATTAPSADQVSAIIFREIKGMHLISKQRAKDMNDPSLMLPGRVTEANEWKIEVDGQSVLVAKGRKPPDNKSEDAFQGIHAQYVLAIGDEACGLTESMIDGLDNITSNETSRRLLIGNPTNPTSHFGKIFRDNTGAWNLISISVFDNPNFHGGTLCSCHRGQPLGLGMNKEALRSMSDESYVKNKKIEYGEDSARYKSRVLGEFAYDAGNQLFNEYDLAQAKNCRVMPDPENDWLILGIDVARKGGDSTVVYRADPGFVMEIDDETGLPTGKMAHDEDGEPIPGIRVRYVDSWKDAPFIDLTQQDGSVIRGSANRIHDIALALGANELRIDASGMGHGVIDPLSEMAGYRYEIIEMFGGGASPDRRAYLNNRAFQYSELRRRAFQGTLDLDPEDDELLDELQGIIYDFASGQSGGGMKIEDKHDMKRRGVKSPDFADAAWYAAANLDHLTEGPYGGMAAGDTFKTDMSDYAPSAFFDYSW